MTGFMIQDGMLALGLIASLSLFLALKWEVQIEARRHQRALEELAAKLRAATSLLAPLPLPPAPALSVATLPVPETALLAVHAETAPLPVRAETAPFPALARSGLNLNRRVQAVRLLRRGEDIGHVCAALGVPRREIELLVRVQRLAAERSASLT